MTKQTKKKSRPIEERAIARTMGKGSPGRIAPGYQITQSWRSICFEIIQNHPDIPLWEIRKEIQRRGIKKMIAGFTHTITKVRSALGITTWRVDQETDPYIIVPVRMSREKYDELSAGGQHVGVLLENSLHKFY